MTGNRRPKQQGCRNYGCNGKGNIIKGRKTHRLEKYCPYGPIGNLRNAKKAIDKRFDKFDHNVENLSMNLKTLNLKTDEEVS